MSDSTALAVVQEAERQHDLVYVKPEDLQVQKMFVPVVTRIPATPDDFHNISGNYMPKGHLTDKIGLAAGIDFYEGACGVEKIDDHTWVGRAQGRRRLPDGTWLTSPILEYEFDAEIRAEEVFEKDREGKYKDEKARKLLLIEFKKFGRARANTGARYRVIRELVGMPISFKRDQLQKALVVHRIAVNTDAMIEDPNLRQAAIGHALHVEAHIFEPEEPKQLEERLVEENGEGEGPEIDFGTAPEEPATEKDDPVQEAKMRLEEYQNNEAVSSYVTKGNGRHPIQAIKETLADENATLEEIENLIELLRKIPGVS